MRAFSILWTAERASSLNSPQQLRVISINAYPAVTFFHCITGTLRRFITETLRHSIILKKKRKNIRKNIMQRNNTVYHQMNLANPIQSTMYLQQHQKRHQHIANSEQSQFCNLYALHDHDF